VPLGEGLDLDRLLAVRHERTTDRCGCFSFHNFTFQVDSRKPLAGKKIKFLFSEKIGFQALCGKEYCPVSFLGMKGGRSVTHIPDVVTALMQKVYSADGRRAA